VFYNPPGSSEDSLDPRSDRRHKTLAPEKIAPAMVWQGLQLARWQLGKRTAVGTEQQNRQQLVSFFLS